LVHIVFKNRDGISNYSLSVPFLCRRFLWKREIIENIILFIPLGMVLCAVSKWDWKRAIAIGLCLPLSIELLQVIVTLGTFEFDDLIHNAVGTVIGCWIIGKIGF